MSSSRVQTSLTGTPALPLVASPLAICCRLDDEVRYGICAAANSAAREYLIDVHLFRLESHSSRDGSLVDSMELLAVPDVAAVGIQPDNAVDRFHRRVREVRKLVGGSHGFCSACDRVRGVAVLARDQPGGGGETVETAMMSGERALEARRIVPFDLQRIVTFFAAQNPVATTAIPFGTSITSTTPGTPATWRRRSSSPSRRTAADGRRRRSACPGA